MNNIIIMAAGASSRMKKTLNEVDLSTEVKELAKQEHKTLIPLKFSGSLHGKLLQLFSYHRFKFIRH